jgi:Tol biopolymer transport system component
MTLPAGSRLGQHVIEARIGAGGMGEVYRARDTRLGRDVAIKLLPAAFSGDADRLRRFEQEARAAAALNHSNILTVHEVGTDNGRPYLVSELLVGRTLREAMGRGALPGKQAIEYAIQICQGLAVAHEKGIIHRDLKPENLFVTEDGRIKILDFGLAKLTPAPVASEAATAVTGGVTSSSAGVVLGTVGYMSPEQARGLAVDHRSDIFSFGSILYEMLSGARAFTGDTAADTLSAILVKDPPDLPIGRGGIPPGVDRIVRRCLEKVPGRRFQSAADAGFALDGLTVASDPATKAAYVAGAHVRRVAPRAVAATALVAGLIGAGMWWAARRASPPAGRMSVVEVSRLTHDVGFSDWPSWSPDGTVFAFSSNRSGNYEIYVRRVEGGQEVNITNDPADDVQPALSPDGSSIVFVSTRSSKTRLVKMGVATAVFGYRVYGGDLWVAPTLGGPARRVVEDGNFPVWRPDGRAIAYVSGSEAHRTILEVPAEGGAPNRLLADSASAWEITRLRYAPDGQWLTFETTERKVFACPRAGGAPQELLSGQSHVWDATGRRLYYVNEQPAGGTRLDTAEIRTRQGNLSAAPSPIGLTTGLLRDLAISADGRYVLASEVQESLNLTRLPLATGGGGPSGPEEELTPSGQVRDGYPQVSPDGRRVLLVSNRLGEQQLWNLDLESRRWERVQVPQVACRMEQASWAPLDGRQVAALCSLPDSAFSIWLIALDGSATRELVSRKRGRGAGNLFCEFSPDGGRLLYGYLKDGINQFFILDLTSGRERQLTTSRSDKYEGKWSPDGRWVAFSANAGRAVQVWRIPAEGGPEQMLTSGDGRMRHKFYSPDGRWLYVQPSHLNIFRLPADGGALQRVTNFPESDLFIEEPNISPDGKFLVYARSRGGSSLWLLTLSAK